MAANWSLYGLFFLTTRETLLLEQRAKGDYMHLRFSQTRDSDEMFSSVVAGGLTGGVLAFITRGRRAVFSGVGFFALVSAVGQFSYTRMNRRRQEIILQGQQLENEGKSGSEGVATSMQHKNEEEEESSSLIAKIRRAVTKDPIERLPEWFPLRRIQPDEYREMLLARKEEISAELERLRATIASMNQREEHLLQKLRDQESK
ncbi:hypothetical protein GQ54DRAFT_318462 [Martensiomyces pterosporus]|nr:hypothetical protein GQ54DRAFT_318462 [Martensiomyces pterosporus]